jgi:hypothetical protein
VPGAEDDEHPNVLYLDTLLRYYMHVDPWTLSDEEWAWTIAYLIDIRKQESKGNGQRT